MGLSLVRRDSPSAGRFWDSGCEIPDQNKFWPKASELDRAQQISQISDQNFSADHPETLVPRGFFESGLCKIFLSKDLSIKILRTNRLAVRISRWANRHCLDHDGAIRIVAQGQMSQRDCGNLLGAKAARKRRFGANVGTSQRAFNR